MIKTLKILFSLFLLASCSTSQNDYGSKDQQGKSIYVYKDNSGTFRLEKDNQIQNSKFISRSQLFDGSNTVLEKNITIMQFGHVANNKLAVRPWASDFTVWFDKKPNTTKTRLDTKNKELDYTIIKDKEVKKKTFAFPSGRFFCYFSQIPNCIISSGLAKKIIDQKSKLEFVIVWESYPFANEQYERIPNEPFTRGIIEYESINGNYHVLRLSFDEQVIFYHFSKNYRFDKMFWIAQGITMERAN